MSFGAIFWKLLASVLQHRRRKFTVTRQPKRRKLLTGEQMFLKLIGQSVSVTSLSITTMSCTTDNNSKPKSMSRAKRWTAEVENLFRFQDAGYRDELEYIQVKQGFLIDRWPETGFVKKLQRRDGTFYYFSRKRECQDRDVHKVKMYKY